MGNLKIFARTFEESARKQVEALAQCKAYAESKIRIMPDAHAGKGCTIGTTMTITDKVTPNLVGVDIGCGMLVVPLRERITDFQKFDEHLRNVVPSGFAVHDKPMLEGANLSWMQRKLEDLCCHDVVNTDYALRSLGTLGGGNHFIEVDEDSEGQQYLVIHSGSRNLGVKVAEYYQEIAVRECTNPIGIKKMIEWLKQENRHSEINETIKRMKAEMPSKELAYVSDDSLREYLHDMTICQMYAMKNRDMIAEALLGSEWYNDDVFTTMHNYIAIEAKILRKGAVSARNGERFIIPMNMRDGSLICIGKGNEDWNQSAPHGAGRLMSRGKAKRTIELDDYKNSMSGIFSTSVDESTIDESPMAYKPMSEIMEAIKDTCEIEKVIKPLYNFKAGE